MTARLALLAPPRSRPRYRVPDARYKSGYRVTTWGKRARLKWQILFASWVALLLFGASAHVMILPVLGAVVLLGYGGYRVRVNYFPARAGTVRAIGAAPLAGETRVRQPVPREVKAAVWQRDGGRCRHCGITDADAVTRTGVHLHYDHIVPFSRNGTDTVNNLQLLCEPCNLRKGNRFAG